MIHDPNDPYVVFQSDKMLQKMLTGCLVTACPSVTNEIIPSNLLDDFFFYYYSHLTEILRPWTGFCATSKIKKKSKTTLSKQAVNLRVWNSQVNYIGEFVYKRTRIVWCSFKNIDINIIYRGQEKHLNLQCNFKFELNWEKKKILSILNSQLLTESILI